jgi:hypothetical protein
MKQKLYSLMLLLAVALTAHAKEAQWCLVVESAGGETIAIGADLKPVIATTSDGYELRYGNEVTSFAWNELKKLTIQQTEADISGTPVERIEADPEKPYYSLQPGEVSIKGAEPGSMAQIYSSNGLLKESVRVEQDGSVNLSTTGLPTGIYIVKTKKSTFKIVKK